jgi:transposase
LKSSYLPEEEQEGLRALVRYRHTLIQDSSRFVLSMQKSLELMNIKIHTIISDLMGKTGKAIIEAIINGERNAEHFIPFVDCRIKTDKATIIKSLQGNWREEHLFTLAESYRFYTFYLQEIKACDVAIESQLIHYEAFIQDGNIEAQQSQPASNFKKTSKNGPVFNMVHYLQRIHRINVMAIYGLSDISALEILAETGTDMSKWKDEKHFVSWLNLCPNNKISGGKIISSNILKKKPNPASQAFRTAANSVSKSNHWLGDYFRRMRAKGGHKYAIVATANKIAAIYYKMLSLKEEFNPVDLVAYQEKYKTAKIAYLERKLQQLKSTA